MIAFGLDFPADDLSKTFPGKQIEIPPHRVALNVQPFRKLAGLRTLGACAIEARKWGEGNVQSARNASVDKRASARESPRVALSAWTIEASYSQGMFYCI